MASVQELLLALDADKSPFISLLEGAAGGVSRAQENSLDRTVKLMAIRQEMDNQRRLAQQDAMIRQMIGASEAQTTSQLNATASPNPVFPTQKLKTTFKSDSKTGRYSPTFETTDETLKPTNLSSEKYTDTEGKVRIGRWHPQQGLIQSPDDPIAPPQASAGTSLKPPPGFRFTANGDLEAIPGGPADEKLKDKAAKSEFLDEKTNQVYKLYETARDGLMSGLENSLTGPIVGRAPAFTSSQQIAEGAVAAMAPVLKQLFRVSGEGVFTDKDQDLLLKMVPKRTDRPDAAKAKIENIDRIVRAKLGVGTNATPADPDTQPPTSSTATTRKIGRFEVSVEP
jgi:hypothetical protein